MPAGFRFAGGGGGEEIHSCEPVELLEVFGSSLALEGLEHDQILAVLEGGVLDVLDRLEEGGYFPLGLPLLFGFVAG